MTPEEADALAVLVRAVDGAGARIRGTAVDPSGVLDEADGTDAAQADDEAADQVTLDPEVAEVCLRELEILVDTTDHPTDEYGDAMTPLTRARRKIAELDGVDHDTQVQVLDIIDEVGNTIGAETSPIDPLQDDIFHAINVLEGQLGADVDDDPEDDERENVEISLQEDAADAGGDD